eukprot:gene3423-2374_t
MLQTFIKSNTKPRSNPTASRNILEYLQHQKITNALTHLNPLKSLPNHNYGDP